MAHFPAHALGAALPHESRTRIHDPGTPAAPWATLRFALPAPTPVSLSVFTSDGRCVRVLLEQELAAGEHVLGWDGADGDGVPAPPGHYTLRLEAAGSTLACRSVWLD